MEKPRDPKAIWYNPITWMIMVVFVAGVVVGSIALVEAIKSKRDHEYMQQADKYLKRIDALMPKD